MIRVSRLCVPEDSAKLTQRARIVASEVVCIVRNTKAAVAVDARYPREMGKVLSHEAQEHLASIVHMREVLRGLRRDIETGGLSQNAFERFECRKVFLELGPPIDAAIDAVHEAVRRWVHNELTDRELLAILTKPAVLLDEAFARLSTNARRLNTLT